MKGISKSIVRNYNVHPYIQTLETKTPLSCKMHRISAKLHEIQTIEQTKIGLSANDDKRFEIPGSKRTLAWGHRRIPNIVLTDFLA